MDRNIVNILSNSGFVWMKDSLIGSWLVLERRRLSTLSVDVLCPSIQSDWTVVITALRLLYCRRGAKRA